MAKNVAMVECVRAIPPRQRTRRIHSAAFDKSEYEVSYQCKNDGDPHAMHVAVMRITRQFHEDSMTDDGANEGAEGKMRTSMDAEVNTSKWKTITG